MCKFLLALTLVFLFVRSVHAAVWINEISPSTDPEWIELHNDGSVEVDLASWLLEDGNSSHSDDLLLSGVISPFGYLVFNHKEGWLNNSGDTLKLYNNASPSAIVDQYMYESVSADKTIARIPSGSESWQLATSSQGVANPIPSPSPSPSPSPTPTPSPSPSPTPTPTPKPSPSPSPTQKPSPSIIVLASPQTGTVAGESVEIDLSEFGIIASPIASPKQLAEAGSLSLNRSRAKTALLTGAGLVILSIVGYLGYRKYKAVYNLEE
jgi:hypothetical protein